jgi:hypothetical protein
MNMSTDLLFYAYRPQPGAMQLNFCLQYISSKYYHTIWIMLITDDDYWEEYRPNCQYIKEIVHAIKAKGKKAGILTSRKWWETNVEADCNDLGT